MKKLIAIFTALSLLFPMGAFATYPSLNGTTTIAGVSAATSLTFARTIAGGLTNPMLMVMVGSANASDLVTGVTWNGTAMTRQWTMNNTRGWLFVYYLVAPASGTFNVVVSTSSNDTFSAVAIVMTDVDQTKPFDNNVLKTAAAGTNQVVVLNTATTNTLVFDEGASWGCAPTTWTVGAGQTQEWYDNDDGAPGYNCWQGSYAQGTTTQTQMSGVLSGSSNPMYAAWNIRSTDSSASATPATPSINSQGFLFD